MTSGSVLSLSSNVMAVIPVTGSASAFGTASWRLYRRSAMTAARRVATSNGTPAAGMAVWAAAGKAHAPKAVSKTARRMGKTTIADCRLAIERFTDDRAIGALGIELGDWVIAASGDSSLADVSWPTRAHAQPAACDGE